MGKSKIKKLTETSKDYISEKEVVIAGESAWLVKKNDHIIVTRGDEVLYDGSSHGYHKFLRQLN